jgi:hypothetical protein
MLGDLRGAVRGAATLANGLRALGFIMSLSIAFASFDGSLFGWHPFSMALGYLCFMAEGLILAHDIRAALGDERVRGLEQHMWMQARAPPGGVVGVAATAGERGAAAHCVCAPGSCAYPNLCTLCRAGSKPLRCAPSRLPPSARARSSTIRSSTGSPTSGRCTARCGRRRWQQQLRQPRTDAAPRETPPPPPLKRRQPPKTAARPADTRLDGGVAPAGRRLLPQAGPHPRLPRELARPPEEGAPRGARRRRARSRAREAGPCACARQLKHCPAPPTRLPQLGAATWVLSLVTIETALPHKAVWRVSGSDGGLGMLGHSTVRLQGAHVQ